MSICTSGTGFRPGLPVVPLHLSRDNGVTLRHRLEAKTQFTVDVRPMMPVQQHDD